MHKILILLFSLNPCLAFSATEKKTFCPSLEEIDKQIDKHVDRKVDKQLQYSKMLWTNNSRLEIGRHRTQFTNEEPGGVVR